MFPCILSLVPPATTEHVLDLVCGCMCACPTSDGEEQEEKTIKIGIPPFYSVRLGCT